MTAPTDGRVAGFRAALLAWYADRGRDLPWRRTRDPWAILVAECMLQQTQVARVAPRWLEFLAAHPTPAAAAAVPVGELLRHWQGLGHNRRAVQLHRAATRVVEQHGGRLPTTLDGLLALPGVGPYTARAVLAFAHERDVGVVDVNAARVLARAVAGQPLGARALQGLADATVPAGQGWAWNQAVLDLGATVCTRRAPSCGGCPVRSWCAWQHDGRATDPADGSAGTTRRQSPFEGSDRQGRGRLLRALANAPVADDAVAGIMGWTGQPQRVARVTAALVQDGLVERAGDVLVLPGTSVS